MQNLNEVFYSSKHYDVVRVDSPLKEEVREKYGILNKQTKVVEYYIDTFDNAMIAAETLSFILDSQTWKTQIEINKAAIMRDSDGSVAPRAIMALQH